MRVSSFLLCVALAIALLPGSASARSARSVDAYEGLATWVDMYDEKPWKHPEETIGRLRRKGVRTLYLQTSNWQARHDIENRKAIGRFLDAAHAADIRVVAWYVPSFWKHRVDLRRTLEALQLRSPEGRTFDSFAMDIEAVNLGNIRKRNERLMWLTKQVRAAVGPDYSLGAIIPDPKTQRYWPRFPYRRVARYYDVFLPMSYFTFRTKGYRNVYRYTRDSLEIIRRRTGRDDVPIHIIGGLAGYASKPDVKAFTKGVRKHGAVGASLYDLPLMTPADWGVMSNVRRPSERRPKTHRPEVRPATGRFARPGHILSAIYL